MRFYRKLLVLVFALAFASVGCLGCGKAAPENAGDTGEPYRIGFVAAITGGASFLGEPERDVAVMIQKQLEAAGPIVGPDGVEHPIEVLIHDTESSGDVAIPVVKKLIDSEHIVALIGPTRSPVSMALIPVVQESEIAMISMASSSAIVEPVAERKWVFKVAQSNKHTAPWQVEYAKAKGLIRIANVYVNNAYGEDGAAAIRATAADKGLDIVIEETFGASDTDMTAQITKIKASGAQAVLVTAVPPAAAIFTKQYRELGLDLPLIHNSGVAMQPFVDLAGAAADGAICPMGRLIAVDQLSDDDPQKAVLQQFVGDFKADYGKTPNHFSAHAWDSFQIVLQVLESLPSGLSIEEQRAQLRDGVESLQGFVGADGTFNFSAEDHVGLSTSDVVLAISKDGDWHYFPETEW